MVPKKVGPCRGAFPRWHYNAASSKCEQFTFGGCKENNNNYLSEQECLNACKNTIGNAHLIVLRQWCAVSLKEFPMLSCICVIPCRYAFSTKEHKRRLLKNLHLALYYTKNLSCHTIRKAYMQLSKSSEILMLFFTDYLLATVPKLNVVLVVHARRQ